MRCAHIRDTLNHMETMSIMINTQSRSYSELITFKTFEDRLNYLKLDGCVGRTTFGIDRYLNQRFYKSYEWRTFRNNIIIRDGACDLGILGLDIKSRIIIHHMNPITIEDFETGNPDILNPEFVITTILDTHNKIHFGTYLDIPQERHRGDTTLW